MVDLVMTIVAGTDNDWGSGGFDLVGLDLAGFHATSLREAPWGWLRRRRNSSNSGFHGGPISKILGNILVNITGRIG